MSDRATPNLAEILHKVADARQAGLHTCMPGRVESYDAGTQRCSVQPLLRRGRRDASGARVVERLPVVQDVPLMFPGSGPFSITWPVAVGDTVLLVFCETSLDAWLGGGTGDEVDPGDERRHALSDAIAIPGLRAAALDGSALDGSAMVISAPGEIHAGGSKSLTLTDDFATLVNTFNSHTHAGVATGSGVTAVPTPLADSPTGTSKLKGG